MGIVISFSIVFAVVTGILLCIRWVLTKTVKACENRAIFSCLFPISLFISVIVCILLMAYILIPKGDSEKETHEYSLIAQKNGTMAIVSNEEVRGTVERGGKPEEIEIRCDDVEIVKGDSEDKLVAETLTWKSTKLQRIIFGYEEKLEAYSKVTVCISNGD